MQTGKLCLSFACAGILLVTGCASFEVRPTAKAITLPQASKPIPVSVGITQVDQKPTGGFPDLVQGLKHALDESHLFQTVYYPMREEDKFDGGLHLQFGSRLSEDPALFPKAFLTGFFIFLPAPIVTYNHKYEADCVVDLIRGDKKLKTYIAKGNVSASHKLFASPSKLESEATEAAAKALYVDLIQQLDRDREFIANELRR